MVACCQGSFILRQVKRYPVDFCKRSYKKDYKSQRLIDDIPENLLAIYYIQKAERVCNHYNTYAGEGQCNLIAYHLGSRPYASHGSVFAVGRPAAENDAVYT